jgi:hypothetical protein
MNCNLSYNSVFFGLFLTIFAQALGRMSPRKMP